MERSNKYLKRFKFLLVSQVILVNDMFSVRKELAGEELLHNLVLNKWKRKELEFQSTLDKIIGKAEAMCREAELVSRPF